MSSNVLRQRQDSCRIDCRRVHLCPVTQPSDPLPRVSFRNKLKAIQVSGNHVRRKAGKQKDNVTPFSPERLSEYDINYIDPGRGTGTPDMDFWEPHIPLKAVSVGPIETRTPPPLPFPTSPKQLHQNLLIMISRDHSPSLPLQSLIRYHSHHQCRAFQSTQSYNLLITLALRHTANEIARKLLLQMERTVPGDMETWKLWVRMMVRRQRWDEAWKSVMSTIKADDWRERMRIPQEQWEGSGMPLVLWMEFLKPMRQRAIRQWSDLEMQLDEDTGEVTYAAAAAIPAPAPTREEEDLAKAHMHALEMKRVGLLMSQAPSVSTKDYMRMPARAVYFIVQSMLRRGDLDAARRLTEAFLGALPPKLDPPALRAALDVIHLHIPWGSRKRSPLTRHYDVRKIVERFLAMNGDLRPNGHTLLLLLLPLRNVKQSGSLARQIANTFCRKWGFSLESPRVRRRITMFALKEGNIKLAETELAKERFAHFRARTYDAQMDVLGWTTPTRHRRLHRWSVFKHSGRERAMWQSLRRKAYRLKQRNGAKAQLRGKV